MLLVSETQGNRIRRIDFSSTTPQVSTLAYGFKQPRGVSIHRTDTFLAVADCLNHAIRRVHIGGTSNGEASTIAGVDPGTDTTQRQGDMDGFGTDARFSEPFDVAFAGDDLLVADHSNKKLRLITLQGENYEVSTVWTFDTQPRGVAVSPDENFVIVACTNAIWKVTDFRSDLPIPTRLAGGTYGTADGNGDAAQFQNPSGLMLIESGNVLIAGVGSHRIRDLR